VTTTVRFAEPLGDLLRQWRRHRGISQLDLASRAEVSARHLSFVENGRAEPSREIVLRLAEALELALRERNQLLLAAGYAPVFRQAGLDAPHLAAVRGMLRQVMTAHAPYPAVVLDRYWNRVEANRPAMLFRVGAAPHLLEEPVNLMRLALHPDGLAPLIVNLGEWRAHLLHRLARQVTLTADPQLAELQAELTGYPCDQPEPELELPGPGDIAVQLRLRHRGGVLSFFSTVSTFGTPLDVTVAELVIESFFPADPETTAVLAAAEW